MKHYFRKNIPLHSAFILNGLITSTIVEPPVEVSIDGQVVGTFQGLELFQKGMGVGDFPQTIADLVSNMYFRLTHQRPDQGSATFGTSIVGSFSYRSSDTIFHLIPEITRAEVLNRGQRCLAVSVFGTFSDRAEVTSVRTYTIDENQHRTRMTLESKFSVLRDIVLHRSRGTDALRLFSLSSMYAGSHCYDGNILRWKTESGTSRQLDLGDVAGRDRYLFLQPPRTSKFQLIKDKEPTTKKKNRSFCDAPSISIKIIEASIPLDQIGLQAFLAPSTNVNDDSLSVWAEWVGAPAVVEAGSEISITVECSAFAAMGSEETRWA